VGHLLGYARVSTAEQNPDLQVDELTEAGCWKVWTDHASGALDRRPQLEEVLGQLRPGDTLVVWRLDRLGRSLRHLIEVVTRLDERGVGFRSLRESIDTTTAGGRLVFHLFGALAQFEREIIRDRTVAGLAAARARGRVGGRPSKLSAEQVRQARRMYDARELTVEQIGAVLGVSRTSIYRALSRDTTPAAVATGSGPAGTGGPVQPGTPGPGARGPGMRQSPAAAAAEGTSRRRPALVEASASVGPLGTGGADGSGRKAVAQAPAPLTAAAAGAHPARRAAAQPRARWYVVDVSGGDGSGAGGDDGGGAVVVLSAHGTQRAALTALARARGERAAVPGEPVGEGLQVRTGEQITRRLVWDAELGRSVEQQGPPS